jgi:hypothetical protein
MVGVEFDKPAGKFAAALSTHLNLEIVMHAQQVRTTLRPLSPLSEVVGGKRQQR